jgi:hypothetical protein
VYLDSTVNTKAILFSGSNLQSSTSTYLQYNEFLSCHFNNISGGTGTAIYATNSKVRVYNDLKLALDGIQNITGDSGIIYMAAGSTLAAENIIFYLNNVTNDGSTIYLDGSSANITNCTFNNNNAVGAGTLYVYGTSVVNITKCNFTANNAYDSSAIVGNRNKKNKIQLVGSKFINNTSTMNLFNLMQSTLTASSCQFLDNIANSVTHGFTLSSSTLTLSGSTVNYTRTDFPSNYNAEVGLLKLNYL